MSGEPILDGFRAIFGSQAAKALALIAATGLVASFHAIIFAYGANPLAVAGWLLPHFLSVTHGTHKTPNIALIAGGLLGLGHVLLFAQGLTFIHLRRSFPNIERPYRSPFGVVLAVLMVIIALVTIGFQLADPHTGVIGVAIWYALAIRMNPYAE